MLTSLYGLWAFLVGSPLKLGVFIGNRVATWTGLLVVWQKLKGNPQRFRHFLGWLVIINAVSFSLLACVLWWLHRHR